MSTARRLTPAREDPDAAEHGREAQSKTITFGNTEKNVDTRIESDDG